MSLTPEGTDSTVGDAPTDSGIGPEELDDPTADGTGITGTFADGNEPDAVDDLDDNHASGGWSARDDDEPLTQDSDGEQDGDEHLPAELDGDAMARPLDGSMNDDDQGMQNAGANLGS